MTIEENLCYQIQPCSFSALAFSHFFNSFHSASAPNNNKNQKLNRKIHFLLHLIRFHALFSPPFQNVMKVFTFAEFLQPLCSLKALAVYNQYLTLPFPLLFSLFDNLFIIYLFHQLFIVSSLRIVMHFLYFLYHFYLCAFHLCYVTNFYASSRLLSK